MTLLPHHTLIALQHSIEKWKANARAKSVENVRTTPSDCALCGLFYEYGCRDCPVAEKTQKQYCMETPYETADAALTEWYRNQNTAVAKEYRNKFRLAAMEEVKFLESLLPQAPTTAKEPNDD